MNSEIKSILGSSITVKSVDVPVAHLRYRGNKKTFVVWTVINELPEFHSDDALDYTSVDVDIDIYSNSDYTDIKNKIYELFTENDWMFVETSSELFEEDEKLYHIVLTFTKEKYVNQ